MLGFGSNAHHSYHVYYHGFSFDTPLRLAAMFEEYPIIDSMTGV